MSNEIKQLEERAEEIEGQLYQGMNWELVEELAAIHNRLQLYGGSLGDMRSALEVACDLDDAETMATRRSDYPL